MNTEYRSCQVVIAYNKYDLQYTTIYHYPNLANILVELHIDSPQVQELELLEDIQVVGSMLSSLRWNDPIVTVEIKGIDVWKHINLAQAIQRTIHNSIIKQQTPSLISALNIRQVEDSPQHVVDWIERLSENVLEHMRTYGSHPNFLNTSPKGTFKSQNYVKSVLGNEVDQITVDNVVQYIRMHLL